MAVTALQMVNRLRRKHRDLDVNAFDTSDELSTVLLDELNASLRELVEIFHFDFDVYGDGILQTKPRQTAGAATTPETIKLQVVNGLSIFTISGVSYDITDITGNFATYLVVTDDPNYANTSFRVTSFTDPGGGVYGGGLAQTFPGTTNLDAKGTLHIYEYGLPSDVRQLVAARHEETPIHVELLDDGQWWNVQQPQPWNDVDDDPEALILGGTMTTTYNADTTSAGTAMTRAMVYPAPADVGATIHYTYRQKDRVLSATTDTIENAPESFVDLVVEMAYARSFFTPVGANPSTGAALEQRAISKAKRLQAGLKVNSAGRKPLRAHGRTAVRKQTWGFGRLPRNVGS